MRELDGPRLHTRIKGRAAIERSPRLLLIRVHRFGRGRARDRADVAWCARTIDALTALLTIPPGMTPAPGQAPKQETEA